MSMGKKVAAKLFPFDQLARPAKVTVAVANRSEPPFGPISAFLAFGHSHIQLLPLSQLHDHAFKPGKLYIKMIA
jgi:hypothetical protein